MSVSGATAAIYVAAFCDVCISALVCVYLARLCTVLMPKSVLLGNQNNCNANSS